ncbi:hypothetical protein HK101_001532 [Irineochytrium annulatum]|nr:hypothetical protein HK101_001532 [Irineochytrium annulatum]
MGFSGLLAAASAAFRPFRQVATFTLCVAAIEAVVLVALKYVFVWSCVGPAGKPFVEDGVVFGFMIQLAHRCLVPLIFARFRLVITPRIDYLASYSIHMAAQVLVWCVTTPLVAWQFLLVACGLALVLMTPASATNTWVSSQSVQKNVRFSWVLNVTIFLFVNLRYKDDEGNIVTSFGTAAFTGFVIPLFKSLTIYLQDCVYKSDTRIPAKSRAEEKVVNKRHVSCFDSLVCD